MIDKNTYGDSDKYKSLERLSELLSNEDKKIIRNFTNKITGFIYFQKNLLKIEDKRTKLKYLKINFNEAKVKIKNIKFKDTLCIDYALNFINAFYKDALKTININGKSKI